MNSNLPLEILSAEAWRFMESNKDAVLVDVRTEMEWVNIGIADLRTLNRDVIKISWRLPPFMEVNAKFLEELNKIVPDTTVPLLFLCKAGGRSREAGTFAKQNGYTECYNISNGFEGFKRCS